MADRQQRPSDWRLVSCPATVALPFYVLCIPWTVILFIVMLRYANQDRTITKSSTSTSPYKAKWYRRQGNKEDPWISLTNHHGAIDDGDILYGGGSYGGSHAKNVLNSDKGANVYIRSKSGSPAQPIIALSLSVFQSLGSSHPSPDPCPCPDPHCNHSPSHPPSTVTPPVRSQVQAAIPPDRRRLRSF